MRALLFAPASNERHLAKVFSCGADAAILDLEDAVAASEKVGARATAVRALATPRRCRAFVRINGLETEYAFGDLAAVVTQQLDGIVLPMVSGPEHIAIADWLITQLERERGLTPGGIEVLPIIETARGLDNVEAIARRSGRVKRLAFGAGDYVNDLGMEWTAYEQELLFARSRICVASRAAGLAPPIDTVHVNIADMEGLQRSALHVRSLGFGGKFCIYPTQIQVVNDVFTPSEAEVLKARKIVDAFKQAEAEGKAAIRVDGAFVDYPIVFRARRVLENHRLATGSSSTAGAPASD
jgi:citrate lyase subunit beta/citryl-CoA lyase